MVMQVNPSKGRWICVSGDSLGYRVSSRQLWLHSEMLSQKKSEGERGTEGGEEKREEGRGKEIELKSIAHIFIFRVELRQIQKAENLLDESWTAGPAK